MHAFADAKMEEGQTEWRVMMQIGCRCPQGKQDAFLERVRGVRAREAPAGWRHQLSRQYNQAIEHVSASPRGRYCQA
jgi:hypothetical protein